MIDSIRKFKERDFFSNNLNDNEFYYNILPFRFHPFQENLEIIVNEVGDYVICPRGTAKNIVERKVERHSELYADLISNFIIYEGIVPNLIDIIATRYRSTKSFLDDFTSLHIFVISLRCNHTCHYCQVSRQTEDKTEFDISIENLNLSIDLMFKSPSPHLTMEFQGGEPLLAFDLVKYAVERAEDIRKETKRNITYVICTNSTVFTDEILAFCRTYDILISTSLDGPEYLHNQNRFKKGKSSYKEVIDGIQLARTVLGKNKVSALMTTSKLSLKNPIEIIDTYIQNEFESIFLRPISPYGFALKSERRNKYDVSDFFDFYKKGLLYILECNAKGVFFVEEYACIILSKVLSPFPVGYVDLQSPSGIINSVIVYNYDGNIYASDESRMMAENNDFTFRLGHVATSSYEEIFFGDKARRITSLSINECLAGCSECAFQSYCGSDPVHNYKTQKDLEGFRPTSEFCSRNMKIIELLFDLLVNYPNADKIFRTWINRV